MIDINFHHTYRSFIIQKHYHQYKLSGYIDERSFLIHGILLESTGKDIVGSIFEEDGCLSPFKNSGNSNDFQTLSQ